MHLAQSMHSFLLQSLLLSSYAISFIFSNYLRFSSKLADSFNPTFCAFNLLTDYLLDYVCLLSYLIIFASFLLFIIILFKLLLPLNWLPKLFARPDLFLPEVCCVLNEKLGFDFIDEMLFKPLLSRFEAFLESLCWLATGYL